MKSLILDLIGLAGFGAMGYGIYLSFGLPVCLMVCGCLVLAASIIAQRNS